MSRISFVCILLMVSFVICFSMSSSNNNRSNSSYSVRENSVDQLPVLQCPVELM